MVFQAAAPPLSRAEFTCSVRYLPAGKTLQQTPLQGQVERSAAWPEQTYGALVVPGELVTEDRHTPSLQRLRKRGGKFTPCKRIVHGKSTIFTPPELSSATHVFVRIDAVHPPLTRPYKGPFRVLERNSKAFLLALPGKDDWVSIDRLKPAFLMESTDAVAAPSPPSRTSPRPHPRKLRACGRPRKGPPATAAKQPHAWEAPPLSSRSRGTLQRPSRYAD
ncbi:uncharacterized protein [Macrobrachium rosenbergii]|uniref:uncharacterized protein n=1 Tax=Macrobrachium rosenbergii TaxID=79674 RepID=UPI0034D4165A